LREDGFKGKLLMITYENTVPYDRPNLSKEYLAGVAPDEWMPLRPKEFYEQYGIEILMGKKVTLADTDNKSVHLDDGTVLNYDRLLLTSGSAPRRLQVPGDDFPNVFYLRTFHDADRIIEATENARKAVIVGSSFIGLETAVSLRKRKLSVTVVTPEKVPFEKVFGGEIGSMFLEAHRKNGVDFRLDSGIDRFEGSLKAEYVVLTNGEKLDADLVLVGIGVRPVTDFIKGVVFNNDGGVKVDPFFRASEDVFAAGDIASYPEWRSGEIIRTEHWRTAGQQGRNAAHNMMGKVTTNTLVPFFWTHQAGLDVRYTGYVKNWDDIIIEGDIKEKDFIAYYVKNNQIYAAAGNKRDKEMAAVEELMRLERMPPADLVRNERPDLLKLLKEALGESRI
ncbi:MAG: NAD(P)/FAD-dependent oxidoreductase, partial [Syntrophothermus sp.]